MLSLKRLRRLFFTCGFTCLFLSVASALALAKPTAEFANGLLRFQLPAEDVIQILNPQLDKNLTGYKVNTDSQTVYTKNFRATLSEGRITVRFDYDAKRRGWTKNPFGGKVYSSWVKDSGWAEFPLFVRIENWQFRISTNYRDVRVSSNNWFTNTLMSDVGIESMVNGAVYDGVRSGLQTAIEGGKTDLRALVVEQGARTISRQTGRPQDQLAATLRAGLDRVRLNAGVRRDGLVVTAPIRDLIPAKVEKVSYTISNDSLRTVAFQTHPSGKRYTLAPGQVFRGTSNEIDDRPPAITIENTGRKYRLTEGDHKFWWKSDERRIAFDRNVD